MELVVGAVPMTFRAIDFDGPPAITDEGGVVIGGCECCHCLTPKVVNERGRYVMLLPSVVMVRDGIRVRRIPCGVHPFAK